MSVESMGRPRAGSQPAALGGEADDYEAARTSPSASSRSDQYCLSSSPSPCRAAWRARARRRSCIRPSTMNPTATMLPSRPVEPHRLRRGRRAHLHGRAARASAPRGRASAHASNSVVDGHVERARLGRLVRAVAPLPARAQALDALVADGDRLRPPAGDLVFLADERRDVAMRHLVGAVVVERVHPPLPGAAGLLLDGGVAHARERGVVDRLRACGGLSATGVDLGLRVIWARAAV